MTNQTCKSFWEECVAQHSFFRLHQPKNPPNKFVSFLNFGSKFQYTGKTEYHTMEESRKRSSHYSRPPSKRYARRTIPVGRPSWSTEQDIRSKNAVCQQVNNHVHLSCETSDSVDQEGDVRSSWHSSHSVASSSASSDQSNEPSLPNGSIDLRPVVHRPKSLTLKSFIYIGSDFILGVNSKYNTECANHKVDSPSSYSEADSRLGLVSSLSNSKKVHTLPESIRNIKAGLESKDLIMSFEKLPRRKEDDQLIESKLKENLYKNRYQDILPYDSTRVQLIDSMTGDYINASFVDMTVPSGVTNRYIATQGPLQSTCDDFWQMIWEQNCSLIIMVTPLIEAGRVKCHKYWPEEKEDVRYGQLLVRNLSEKSKTATINRTIQLLDVKSGEKRITKQIQYKAWPDHQVPEDCNDFLKLVNRVRKHRLSHPNNPIVVHCSAGIGRTGVLILMETAICTMESGEPIYPIKILEDMRRQRAMLVQTNSQFQFVAGAICKVYNQKFYKKSRKHIKK